MANEQTSVPLFVADTILTAAQQNISAATGVPVFATTVTRDAAFGGANKALAEGQLCYLSASNIVQYYDGAAWATVGPATGAGLVCVKAETAFTAVSDFFADSIFTTTYTNYKMVVRTTCSTSGNVQFLMRAATVDTTANYNHQRGRFDNTSATADRSTGNAAQTLGDINGAFFSIYTIDFFAPFLAEPTQFNMNSAINYGAYTTPINYFYSANQSDSTSFDGVKFAATAGTITGTYTIWAYAKAV